MNRNSGPHIVITRQGTREAAIGNNQRAGNTFGFILTPLAAMHHFEADSRASTHYIGAARHKLRACAPSFRVSPDMAWNLLD